jgi:hypothetical protein
VARHWYSVVVPTVTVLRAAVTVLPAQVPAGPKVTCPDVFMLDAQFTMTLVGVMSVSHGDRNNCVAQGVVAAALGMKAPTAATTTAAALAGNNERLALTDLATPQFLRLATCLAETPVEVFPPLVVGALHL